MLKPSTRLAVNEAEVAARVIDGEAILINLSNGTYYSTDQVGGTIWELIERGHSLEEMVEAVIARYDVPTSQAQADVERLAEELVEESLALLSEDKAPGSQERSLGPEQRLAYESPQLNIYRDMADLLALDPPTPGLEYTPWE